MQALTPGQRRRRPRLRTVGVVLVVLVVLVAVGLATLLTAAGNDHVGVRAATVAVGPTGKTGKLTRVITALRRDATAQRQRKESAAIDRVLRYTPFLANGTPRRRMIALTFDDGPSPYTPQIIRILLRLHAPATFFIVGLQLKLFAAGLRDEVQHGFAVGDHTQNHALLPRLAAARQLDEINAAATGPQRLGAPFPRLFRPPYGAYNKPTLAALKKLKMLMVLWSVDPGDWRRPGVGPIVKNVLATARPGAVVIMHDGGGDRSQTVTALPQIINGLRKRHYQLVSVPQLLMADPPPAHQRLPQLSGV